MLCRPLEAYMSPRLLTDTDQITNSFEHEAEAVLRDLRPALAAILDQLRPPVLRASQLKRLLDMSQQVSWGLFNAATARDAHTLASLLPGRRAMETFFDAALRHGVPPASIDRARAAFARFEQSVERHAGNRGEFESMMADLGEGQDSAGSELKYKRAAFRANTILWGRQAQAFCAATILHPGATPGRLDEAFIKGLVGLRRTRRTTPMHTTEVVWRTPAPGDPPAAPRVPIDPREVGPESIGLLRDFCSRPTPEFRPRQGRPGLRVHELMNDNLGRSGEVTYFTGDAYRDDTAAPGTEGSLVGFSKIIDIPIQAYVGDVVIHKSAWGTGPPEVDVCAFHIDGSLEYDEADRLPMTEKSEYLGEGIDAARTPLIPRYADLLTYAIERMGWNPDEFRVFRCRVEYPVMYTRIGITLK
jgi:hypothetical protein